MAYQSLYRKYRPKTFDEVVGQQHIVVSLKNAIKRDKLAHAYLFTGPRGTGKTTIAKLLAKGVNCLNKEEAPCLNCENCKKLNSENHPDIIEIDAASNNGVNDIRDIIERVKYAPLQATYKVYIIDEVHMLSTGAFNALLKTLEEPPSHVIFVLATTEIHKVLPTIISRTQRYDFSRVTISELTQRLSEVLKHEQIEAESGVIEEIAYLADGGFRDALTILEQVIAYAQDSLTLQDVFEVNKISTPKEKVDFINAIVEKDLSKALLSLQLAESKSVDFKRFILDVINVCKEYLIYTVVGHTQFVSTMNIPVIDQISPQNNQQLHKIIKSLLEIQNLAKFSGYYQNYLELSVIELCKKEVIQIQPEIIQSKNIENNTKEERPIILKENDNGEIIEAMMVLGDKSLRQKYSELLANSQLINDPKYKRIKRFINRCSIGVVSHDLIVLTTTDTIEMALKNEETNKVLNEYIYHLCDQSTTLVVDENLFKQRTSDFLRKRSSQLLMSENKAEEIIKQYPKFKLTSGQTKEELIRELFGGFTEEE